MREDRHALADGEEERWWLDFTSPVISGYVRLAYRPWERRAWWWAAVVGPDQELVAVRADDVDIPARGTEIRADGVWAALTCETPELHWSVGLESFGASFEDPVEAWGEERGEIVPFGLDLEWEAVDAIVDAGANVGDGAGYGQWCEVHGDVLLGSSTVDIAGVGHREHMWGAPEGAGWRLAVGGRVWERGVDGLTSEADGHGLPVRASVGELELSVRYVSPVKVPGLRVVHAVVDSPAGPGWLTLR